MPESESMTTPLQTRLAGAALLAALSTSPAFAQWQEDKWTFDASIYLYLPDIGGHTAFPPRSGGSNINVSIDTILDNLNFTFMGTFEARKGRWGVFTDFIYLDVDGDHGGTRDFSVGNIDVPGNVTADLKVGVKGTAWTLAGTYRLAADPAFTADLLFGARLLDIDQTLDYDFSGDFGQFVGPGRAGRAEANLNYWDAVVGVKGRYRFGENKEWFIPYYVDVGTGDSDLTWQAFTGIGYTFSWGSLLGGWRYLDYDFKSSSKVEKLDFNGPMLGVAFAW